MEATRAATSTSSPACTGTVKSMRSTCTVTQVLRARREAATKHASSIILSAWPPKRVPMWFVWSGKTMRAMRTSGPGSSTRPTDRAARAPSRGALVIGPGSRGQGREEAVDRHRVGEGVGKQGRQGGRERLIVGEPSPEDDVLELEKLRLRVVGREA